ncbi:MAG: amidohydrolase family protein [Planctomycetes bacterium]|nr:amidohydrolase family protein [Planctomycetota bacterium]
MVEVAVDGLWSEGEVRGATLLRFAPDGALERHPAPAGTPAAARSARGLFALPGFVDAHVHLELSSMHGETLPHGSFSEWVAALVARQRSLGPDERAAAVRSGADELLSRGCVAIGDIDSHGETLAALSGSPLEGVVHREWLGAPSAERLAECERTLDEQQRALASLRIPPRRRAGLSPHAPYTTSPELYATLFDWVRRYAVPVASHVAESPEELLLLAEQRGPLAEFFGRIGFAPPRWPDARAGPLLALDALSPPPGFTVIHGNQLTPAEIARCAARRWPVVHCPRSHAYFGYSRNPARELLAAGVTVALGTDSRASNFGLDLHAELATWRARDPSLSDQQLLVAATAAGRCALGLPRAELRAGDAATFQLVRGRDGPLRTPDELLPAVVRGGTETVAVWIRGQLAWSMERGAIPPSS